MYEIIFVFHLCELFPHIVRGCFTSISKTSSTNEVTYHSTFLHSGCKAAAGASGCNVPVEPWQSIIYFTSAMIVTYQGSMSNADNK